MEEFSTALYDVFEKSPNVMEIRPKREKFGSDVPLSGLAFLGNNRIRLLQGLELRVALSEQQRKEFSSFLPAPEQFWIYYDGCLFCAVSEVASLPAPSSVGQAARDFLRSVTDPGTVWKRVDTIGPTPIHPDIYLIEIDVDGGWNMSDRQLFPIEVNERDVVLLYPVGTPLSAALEQLRWGVLIGISEFYQTRVICRSIDTQLRETFKINDQLSGLMAEFFNRSVVSTILRRDTWQIRRLISQLHLRLQELSRLDISLKERLREMNSSVERNIILERIGWYLNEHATEHEEINKDAQLKLMDYVASETMNFGVIQAIVWASVIGALVASLVTLVFK